ncbi:MAG: cytochrome c-type biogenesis CcmF C-terminal domain-containing protein, partial [Bacteroidota bacterium]
LYSTFLTRSGVLGDSSVHAFTEMGLEWQLVLFMATYLGIGLWLFFARNKSIPAPEKEEPTSSKEFWMFIGTLVLLFSAAIITASTSLPVFNKIVQAFNPDFKGFTITEPIEHFNKYQLWIGIFIGLLSGGAQWLRYREINWKSHARKFAKHTAIAGVAAILLSVATSFWIQMGGWQVWVLLFAGLFTLVSNLDYLFTFLRGNLKLAGSVFSHVGFGLMIVGTIASGLNKRNISTNPVMQQGLLDDEMLEKNVLIFKGMPMYMSGYRVTYTRDTMIGNLRTFFVDYEKLDEEGNVVNKFTVEPSAIYDNKVVEVKAFNPSTKRYLDRDIFTHVATLHPKEANFELKRTEDDTLNYQTYPLSTEKPYELLDTVEMTDGSKQVVKSEVSLLGINRNPIHPDYKPQPGDLAVAVKVAFKKEDTTFVAEPVLVLREQLLYTFPVQMNDLSLRVRLTDEALDKLFPLEENLGYKPFKFKQNEQVNFNGMTVRFAGFNKEPKHPAYQKQEGDIAVAAQFEVTDPATGKAFTAEPLYLIRGSTPLNLKAEIEELGMHLRFTAIDPQTETIEVLLAQKRLDLTTLPVQIAKKSFRTDFIVLEAIIFPGINLFWLGTTLMMFGLAFSMVRRLREKNISKPEAEISAQS